MPARLRRKLTAWLDEHTHELGEEGRQKLATSPLRVFDVKEADASAARGRAEDRRLALRGLQAHFAAVRADLDATGVEYELVPTLVRGLDYYSRTTWEFVGPMDNENATISGGGRYDYLVEEIGGPPTPGVGFGAGIERLLIAIEDEAWPTPRRPRSTCSSPSSPTHRASSCAAPAGLRDAGIAADTDYAGRSLKGQLTQAGRSGARRP